MDLNKHLELGMKDLQFIFQKKDLREEGVDGTLFIHRIKSRLLVAQIYVDDISFGATLSDHALSFAEDMKKEFEMSMIGELNFFLGLHIRQLKNDYVFFFYLSPNILGSQ